MKPASKIVYPFVLPERAVNLAAVCIVTAALTACGGDSGGGTVEGGSGDNVGAEDLEPNVLSFGEFDPTENDLDGDGLTESEEIALGLNPLDADSDIDDIFDGDEDNDGDGDNNLDELNAGSDPTDPTSTIDGPTDTGTGTACADTNSSDASWSNNCLLQNGGEFATSLYTQGVQRILFCQGAGGTTFDINDFADGIFGPLTAQAVEAFQTSENITVDGIVGPETWGRLFDTLNQIEGDVLIDGIFYEQNSIDGCDANTVQFFQEVDDANVLQGWRMASESGSFELVDFSIDPPVQF